MITKIDYTEGNNSCMISHIEGDNGDKIIVSSAHVSGCDFLKDGHDDQIHMLLQSIDKKSWSAN